MTGTQVVSSARSSLAVLSAAAGQPSTAARAHLDSALLGLVLGAGQARAPHDGEPVLDELLDQREVAVVQQLQQVALQIRQALAALRQRVTARAVRMLSRLA